jgi:hypothetical protein
MTDNRNQDREKIDAFFKSRAGFWTVVVVVAGIAIWAVVSTIIGMFHH